MALIYVAIYVTVDLIPDQYTIAYIYVGEGKIVPQKIFALG